MEKSSKIYVAGHRGMVGSAICRKLNEAGYSNIITRTFSELDLRSQQDVLTFFAEEEPEYVFMAAAKVGGIMAGNTRKAEFIYDNLMIAANVIHAAYLHKVKKLLFPASSGIYPKMAPQPIKEEYLLTSELETNNESYAIAKITGIKLCEAYRDLYGCNFISVVPANVYGLNDHYDLENSHVLPSLIRKFHEAKENNSPSVTIWGSGSPRREFLFADDLAEACIHLMQHYNKSEIVNIGTGEDISVKELAMLIKEVVGYNGILDFDTSRPDGTPKKLMDVSKLHKTGFWHKTGLTDGIKIAYADFMDKKVLPELAPALQK